MTRLLAFVMITMCLLLAGCGDNSPSLHPEEAAAVERIRSLGGKVELSGDHRVIKVYLHETKVMDDDLAQVAKLSKLQNLFLGKTPISDAGLAYLSTLTELKTLSLNSTHVTDAGLKNLSALTKLKTLNLQETQVTAAGMKRLKQSVPDLKIAR